MPPFILATRGSRLALWQAEAVRDQIQRVHPGILVQLHIVKTEGDREQAAPIAGLSMTGVFTREVDAEVLAGRAHAAVHSLKDQTTTLPDGLVLGMVLERGPVEDAIIGGKLKELPKGAKVATGSLRRQAQVLRVRPDLEIVAIRGNVDTRVQKVEAGEVAALILARAGLVRLGLDKKIAEVLPLNEHLPAPSQGIVGVTCRASDHSTVDLLLAADDGETHEAAIAERAFLGRLGGGCNVPAAAWARREGADLVLDARLLGPRGEPCVTDRSAAMTKGPAELGVEVADRILKRGGRDILRGLKS